MHYKEKERIVIKKILNKLKTSGTITKQYDRWDFDFQMADKKFTAELKCRNCFPTTYKDSLIQQDKYEALIKRAKETNSIPLYFVHYENNEVYYWDLRKENLEWSLRECNTSTCFGNGERKDKWVSGLQFKKKVKI